MKCYCPLLVLHHITLSIFHNLLCIPTSNVSCQPLADQCKTVNLQMVLLNIRFLVNKTFLINDLILSQIDCLFLNETHLLLLLKLPHKIITSTPLDDCFDVLGIFEYHAVILKCQVLILAVTVYRPLKHCPNFLSDFSKL